MSAYFHSLTVHDCKRMTAEACSGGANDQTTWLDVKFTDVSYPACSIAIFMPLDRAARLAAAINAAEAAGDQPTAIPTEAAA